MFLKGCTTVSPKQKEHQEMSLPPRTRITLIQLQLPVALLLLASFFLVVPDTARSEPQNVQQQSSAGTRSAAPTNVIKPSLDMLKARVNAYWSLLARERKSEALQYVEPSRRADFKAWPMPRFSEPRITTLALSPKTEEVSVTVEVKRVFPPPMPTTPFSWPVTESWVFLNGNWFVQAENEAAVPFSAAPGRPIASPLSPAEIAKRQKAIQDALHFGTTDLDFGTVRRGDSVALSLGYELTGNEAFGIFFRDPPDDFFVRNLPDRTLPAGKAQIQADFLTKAYAGEVNEKLTAIISSHGTEVPYEFKLHGFVYTPVYTTPMTLRFKSGEHAQEILVKNISKSEVVINNYLSTKEFDVTPLPQTIPPGSTCTLEVSIIKDRPEKNLVDTLYLSFDKSVEDQGGLDVGIVRNYQEVHQKSRAEELQELLKKSGIVIKK
jgi:hypothetical protein